MMLKLKLQYFGHLMQRVDWLEKTLMLGGIGVWRRRGWQRMRWLDDIRTRWTWVWVISGRWWWTGRPGMLRFMGSQRVGHDWATVLNLTELKKLSSKLKAWISSVHHELVFNNFCLIWDVPPSVEGQNMVMKSLLNTGWIYDQGRGCELEYFLPYQ